MKIHAPIIFLCIFFLIVGCKKESNPVTPPPKVVDSTIVNYEIDFFGLNPLRDSEFYVLWIKVIPDSSWRMTSVLHTAAGSPVDTAIMYGAFRMIHALDSISDVLITLEHTSSPSVVGLPIARSEVLNVDSAKRYASSFLNANQFLGDYSALQGGLVFTSNMIDSLAYTHEFYLMNLLGTKQTPSLFSLNAPPNGWKYGLWAEDLNFTPHEYFFYGLFSNPIGHDSDSTNDSYPYPGGWKPQRMDMASGSIIVTLEPLFYGDSLKFKGPSAFTILQFNRIPFIDKNKNYPMGNVSLHNIPRSGTIEFTRN